MIRIAESLPSDDGPYEYRGHFDAELHSGGEAKGRSKGDILEWHEVKPEHVS
jgi:hypothetical protein